MDISLFDYKLPEELIAQSPTIPRDHSRLLIIDRKDGSFSHKHFYDIIDYLTPNDVVVLNKTKVFPARFFGKKKTGGKIEVLLIEEVKTGIWKALTKPGFKVGQIVIFEKVVFDTAGHEEQIVLLKTKIDKIKLLNLLEKFGHIPLPPYIHSKKSEKKLREEYQTVYAKITGSVAAPTAGFHFTEELLDKIKAKGVQIEYVTLHVGLGTFAPVKTKKIEDHPMHFEYFEVEPEVADRLNKAKKSGKRTVLVGTTTTRVLETLVTDKEEPCQLDTKELRGSTNLFIFPPYKYKFIDALITNFHLPKSTLLCLVSAFVSSPNTDKEFGSFEKSLMGRAYKEAVKEKYRFYSFGDACFIV